MDMEKSASRFKFFDTARNFGCIFFCENEELAYCIQTKKERKMQYGIFVPRNNRRKCEKYT